MAVYEVKTYFDCVEKASEIALGKGKSLDEKIIIFCEDKMTLTQEESLVKRAGGIFNTEVLTFDRFMLRGNVKQTALSKEGSAMVVKKVLSSLKGELKALARLNASPSFSLETASLIAQLKSAKVSFNDLYACLDDCPKSIQDKIYDIAKIYESYEKFLNENGIGDVSGKLDGMKELVLADENLKNTHVIFAGYSSVTKQSAEVISEIYKRAKSCDFVCVSGDNEELYDGQFLEFSKTLTKEKEITAESSASKENELILDRLFNPIERNKVGVYSNKVKIYEATNISDEVDFVAKRIKHAVINGEKRYKDICLGVGNLPIYSLLIKQKFADYEIPYFSDEKRSLLSHPLSKLINDCVSLASRKDISYLKSIISNSLYLPDKSLSDGLIRTLTLQSATVKTFLKGNVYLSDISLCNKKDVLISFINTLKGRDLAENYTYLTRKFLDGISYSDTIKVVEEKLLSFNELEEESYLTE